MSLHPWAFRSFSCVSYIKLLTQRNHCKINEFPFIICVHIKGGPNCKNMFSIAAQVVIPVFSLKGLPMQTLKSCLHRPSTNYIFRLFPNNDASQSNRTDIFLL
ncbi:hypothetical protein CDIK_2660 [Cucumispora dikerogammari]|nr:hypothetical protein CDIK_2660 [Cucumispora dikerogammari]